MQERLLLKHGGRHADRGFLGIKKRRVYETP
jgi:hypothetical protein